ncbi:LysR family transcriptional regulator [Vibrio diazotrophicus]|uniref:LysR family transcriptional regulator n=1 Tax=Vibrio diazotrophicus TaxID=685 RepID=UPI000C9DF9A3|nr:LysR family transcriptional regulator [Vibrio diazotrophicus]PNH78547.1 LysR family transcriptional regulator [Vibrio diazotrophicus]
MENKVNLNLINTLILLKKHRSMRTVAKVLGKSESAVSKDLSKLRNEFSDSLFIKTQNGFEATHYLDEIYDDLESAYFQLVNVVNKPIEFQPHLYQDLITIAIADAEYDHIVSHLYPKLMEYFPKAKFNFVTWKQESLENLLQGNIDCGVHLQNDSYSKDFYQKTLKVDQIVTAVHKQFGITQWQETKQLPFVFIDVPGWNEFSYRFEDILPKEHKQDITYCVRVDKLASALSIAANSRTAIQCPTRYLDDDFSVIPYPKGVSFDVAYSFYCLQTKRHSPLIQLLHQLINECY